MPKHQSQGCVLQGACPGDILNSNFTNNIAQQDGGAHWINVAPTLTVYGNSYISNNSSTGSAGISAQAVVASTFSQLRFGNNVGQKGTALFQGNCNSTAITNSTFYNNTATTFGGAVFRWAACLCHMPVSHVCHMSVTCRQTFDMHSYNIMRLSVL